MVLLAVEMWTNVLLGEMFLSGVSARSRGFWLMVRIGTVVPIECWEEMKEEEEFETVAEMQNLLRASRKQTQSLLRASREQAQKNQWAKGSLFRTTEREVMQPISVGLRLVA